MKSASPELIEILQGEHVYIAELYTLTLIDGTVLRYTTADKDLVYDGNTYSSSKSLFSHANVRWTVGLEVDTLELEVYPSATDLIGGVPFLHAVRLGMFDSAEVLMERAYMAVYGDTSPGVIRIFRGEVGDIDPAGPSGISMAVNSFTERLRITMPRRLYGPSCDHTLYGVGCEVSRTTFRVTATVGAGATVSSIPVPGTGKANGWFDLGLVTVGGATRTVKRWAADTVHLFNPLRSAPAEDDEVLLLPGCDKKLTTCENKFDKRANYHGHPFVPVPETSF